MTSLYRHANDIWYGTTHRRLFTIGIKYCNLKASFFFIVQVRLIKLENNQAILNTPQDRCIGKVAITP